MQIESPKQNLDILFTSNSAFHFVLAYNFNQLNQMLFDNIISFVQGKLSYYDILTKGFLNYYIQYLLFEKKN
jgi:CMP-N-acetylneuraminic acid synthetase